MNDKQTTTTNNMGIVDPFQGKELHVVSSLYTNNKAMTDKQQTAMKTKEEIQKRLLSTLMLQEYMIQWVRTSHEAYMKEKKKWGDQADYYEVKAARNALAEITAKVETLEWVLDINQIESESLDEENTL